MKWNRYQKLRVKFVKYAQRGYALNLKEINLMMTRISRWGGKY
jgi:hypothetical protein